MSDRSNSRGNLKKKLSTLKNRVGQSVAAASNAWKDSMADREKEVSVEKDPNQQLEAQLEELESAVERNISVNQNRIKGRL